MVDIASRLPVLYEDDVLIAIHKPAGLLVHRSEIDRHESHFAVQMLRDQINQKVYPVHRLDKPTSGVLLFAKDSRVLPQVCAQFESHQVEKRYQALVRGYTPAATTIKHPVKSRGDDRDPRSLMAPKEGLTELRTLHQYELPFCVEKYPASRYSLVELTPRTGRRHQLRYHMKHISHPIIGDTSYGRSAHNRYFREHFNSDRLLLAAVKMVLVHPLTAETVLISAPLQSDFDQLIRALASSSRGQVFDF